jgi:protease-4
VAEGRNRPVADIEALAQGRVWMGAQAKQKDLVDELGGLDRAIELVKQRAKLASGDKVSLVLYPEKQSALEMLFGSANELVTVSTQSRVERELNAQLRAAIPGANWRILVPGGMLRMMPFGVSIH